ncbi:hypothetical protein [Acidovorax sp. LjRoot66]|uniref:hypothetical protein n=1 Tax=Acidovorax sp. LjRoot66 TaxID=3342334 RepID=UPI003F501471
MPLSDLVQTMHAHAARLRALYGRIGETCAECLASAAANKQWQDACSDFHDVYDDLFFPGGGLAWEQFIDGSSPDVSAALAFLQADPWYHRSGYHKQVVWHRFKRIVLTREELQQLEGVALDYLGRRVRREFWHMARFVRLRGSTDFWQRVEQMASDPVRSAQAIKATWLVLAGQNKPVCRAIAGEVRRASYQPGYQAVLDLRSLAVP